MQERRDMIMMACAGNRLALPVNVIEPVSTNTKTQLCFPLDPSRPLTYLPTLFTHTPTQPATNLPFMSPAYPATCLIHEPEGNGLDPHECLIVAFSVGNARFHEHHLPTYPSNDPATHLCTLSMSQKAMVLSPTSAWSWLSA